MADQEHMFTGVAKLWPGGYEPEHIHDTPMAYYIIEVKNKFDSNNDASNECENERISLNLLEFA